MTIMTMEVEHARIREALLYGGETASFAPETLFFIESELIEDHLEGSLTPAEAEMFLANFLITEERREHLNEVRMLKRFSSDAFEFDASAFDEPTSKSEEPVSRTVTIIVLTAVTLILIMISARLLE